MTALPLGIAILVLIARQASGPWQDPSKIGDVEVRALPPYCRAQGFIRDDLSAKVSESEIEKWKGLLGPGYLHVHHYCWALNALNLAHRASDEGVRQRYYDYAVKNIEYVQRNAGPTLPIMPEILVKKGYVLRLMGQDAASSREFLASIALRPDYTPAYAGLSEYYQDLGDREQARRVLEEGLSHSPKSEMLKRKLAELDDSP